MPPSLPYDFNHPYVSAQCATAINTGPGYQWLAIGTGGYRFPVCEGFDFGPIFQRIADDVVVTTAIPCTIDLPEPMGMDVFDLDHIDVSYKPTPNSPSQAMKQVGGIGDCQAGQAEFFLENGNIELCPDICAIVSANAVPDGEISIDVHCEL
jgi:hypothetical protein